VLERGEKIELLVEKTEQLNQTAVQFKKKSTGLKRAMWWKNVKLTILLVLLALVFTSPSISLSHNHNHNHMHTIGHICLTDHFNCLVRYLYYHCHRVSRNHFSRLLE
jgi:hypothetical protein